MRSNATRILLAAALAAILQARAPVFATPWARRLHSSRRRAADEPSAVVNLVQDPSLAAPKPAAELVQGLEKAHEFARAWGGQAPFAAKDAEGAGKHVERLTGEIAKAVAGRENVLIPFAQDLPPEPIRGTPFEKLMVAVPQNTSVAGVYALHAERGAGKSTAATLAALELKGRQPKDVIILLQNDFERQLESFFRLSNLKYTAEIASAFFTNLKEKGIRVRLILDNVLDGGTTSAQSAHRYRMLARAANDNLHQVIVIVQSEAAAKNIGDLSGDTTQKGNQMPAEFYRWSREGTLELLNRTTNTEELLKKRLGDDGEADDLNVLEAEALERSKIPDEYGRWRPRSTIRYIMTGDTPQRAPSLSQALASMQRGCFFKNDAELIHVSFSVLYSKKCLMNSWINLERLASLNDLMLGTTALTKPVWVRQLVQDWQPVRLLSLKDATGLTHPLHQKEIIRQNVKRIFALPCFQPFCKITSVQHFLLYKSHCKS